MKKLLGIVVLGLLFSINAHSEDKIKKSLSYLENTVFISGNEWGGKIFVVGVGTRKDGMERWLKRMDLIASERPQKEFCNLFGLKAKKFEFEILKQENYIANKRKKKYLGSTEKTHKLGGKDYKTSTPLYGYENEAYSQILFTDYKFECDNKKLKSSEKNNELITQIQILKELYDEGSLTKEQFEKAKDKLLN